MVSPLEIEQEVTNIVSLETMVDKHGDVSMHLKKIVVLLLTLKEIKFFITGNYMVKRFQHILTNFSIREACEKLASEIISKSVSLLFFSMNYRDFSVKSKLIISLF